MKLLIVEDDQSFRKHLARAFSRRGYTVIQAENGERAVEEALSNEIDGAIVDMRMPGMNGVEVIRKLSTIRPSTVSIVLTGYGSISNAVEAVKAGASDYLLKPCTLEELESTLRRYIKGPEGETTYHGIVGRSKGIKEVIRAIELVKDTSLPVLITGESGTGKELVARAIHYGGIRGRGPFVAVNCASLKPELLENELFGHVKGAFTGATTRKDGLLKVAHGGSLFIDEIGDMDPTVQASLLRFVETGCFRPLGDTKEIGVDVRIIGALNKDIEEEVRKGNFRKDLYYRLNVCRIRIPPLRERKEDIPLIVEHFLKTSPLAKKKGLSITPGAMEVLTGYDYPGNVRELFNILNRAILFCQGDTLTADLLLKITGSLPLRAKEEISILEDQERTCVMEALKKYNWNISKTARYLGIHRRTLQRKLKRWGIR